MGIPRDCTSRSYPTTETTVYPGDFCAVLIRYAMFLRRTDVGYRSVYVILAAWWRYFRRPRREGCTIRKCTKRMLHLREFTTSAAFTRNLLVRCVSSIPIWEFARRIQTCKDDVGTGRCGVSDRLHREISETKCIIGGWNNLEEYRLGCGGGMKTLYAYKQPHRWCALCCMFAIILIRYVENPALFVTQSKSIVIFTKNPTSPVSPRLALC